MGAGVFAEVNIASPGVQSLLLALAPNPACRLAGFAARVSNEGFGGASARRVAAIALQNSPYWVVRDDEYANRYTDLPMKMSYRVYPAKRSGFTDIDYIIYFSDEDSGRSSSNKSASRGNYGRSSDIEWVYRVLFDSGWNAVRRTIQTSYYLGPFNLGFGHGERPFRGELVGSHPVLYDATLNNVASDHPKGPRQAEYQVAYQMVPGERLQLTDPIEGGLLDAPWTYEVTQDEQVAEGKAPAPAIDHLFVLVEGRMKGIGPLGSATGEFMARATLRDPRGRAASYQSEGKGVSRPAIMGDRWLRSSRVAS